jgi:type III pantothenate kinase
MLLTIDIGNTNTVLGVFDGERSSSTGGSRPCPTGPPMRSRWCCTGLLARSATIKEPDLHGISLCSTVPSVLHEMREMCRRYYPRLPAVIVAPGVKTGVPIGWTTPRRSAATGS